MTIGSMTAHEAPAGPQIQAQPGARRSVRPAVHGTPGAVRAVRGAPDPHRAGRRRGNHGQHRRPPRALPGGDRRVPGRGHPRCRGRVGDVRPPSAGQRAPRAPCRMAARGLRRGLRVCAGQPARCRPARARRGCVRDGRCSRTQLQAQVASSVASFANGWDLALAIFGLHLARPRRPGLQVGRLPEVPRWARDSRRHRVPGRFVRDDPRPGLHLDHQHLHVRRRGAADRLALPARASRESRLPESPPTAAPDAESLLRGGRADEDVPAR